jgi:hypothetical protein
VASAATPFSSEAMRSSSTSGGGVHDTRVNVAELLKREQIRRVLGVVET